MERTLLAYIRTGLALIGVGFVMARFGLLMRELGLRSGSLESPGMSLWFGALLVCIGGLVGPLAALMYIRQLRRLNEAMGLREKAEVLPVALSILLAGVGVGMAFYLVMSR